MRFSALRPEIQVRLAVVIPLIALFLFLFAVYPAWGRYTEASARSEQQERELADLRAAPLPPPVAPGIIVEAQPSEPPQFLEQISMIAVGANCHILGFDLVPAGTPAPAPTPGDAGLIKAVRARIELDATYPQVRAFLYRLAGTLRPFTVTEVNLTTPGESTLKMTTVGTLHASIDIERYVVPPAGQSSGAVPTTGAGQPG